MGVALLRFTLPCLRATAHAEGSGRRGRRDWGTIRNRRELKKSLELNVTI